MIYLDMQEHAQQIHLLSMSTVLRAQLIAAGSFLRPFVNFLQRFAPIL